MKTIRSYENFFELVKETYDEHLPMTFSRIYLNKIKNVLAKILLLKVLPYSETYEFLNEPVMLIPLSRGIEFLFSIPLLAFYFNQPIHVSFEPPKKLQNPNVLESLLQFNIEAKNTEKLSEKQQQTMFVNQFLTKTNEYTLIQTIRIVMLCWHIQQHYKTCEYLKHDRFRQLEMAERSDKTDTTDDDTDEFDDDDNDEDDDYDEVDKNFYKRKRHKGNNFSNKINVLH